MSPASERADNTAGDARFPGGTNRVTPVYGQIELKMRAGLPLSTARPTSWWMGQHLRVVVVVTLGS